VLPSKQGRLTSAFIYGVSRTGRLSRPSRGGPASSRCVWGCGVGVGVGVGVRVWVGGCVCVRGGGGDVVYHTYV